MLQVRLQALLNQRADLVAALRLNSLQCFQIQKVRRSKRWGQV